MSWFFGVSQSALFPFANHRVRFAPDDGGGDGGGEGGDPDGEPDAQEEKKFSEKDLQAAIKRRGKKMEKSITDLTSANDQLKQQLEEIQKKIDDKTEEAGGDPDAASLKKIGGLEDQKRKLEQQLNEANSQIKTLTERVESAEVRRRNIERDQSIDGALNAVGCIDVPNARLLFQHRLDWDEDEEKFYFRTKNGNMVEVDAGIAAECPDYMKPASSRGGSGANGGGSARRNANQKILDTAKATYEQAKAALDKAPTNEALRAKFLRASKNLKALETVQN